MFVEELCMHLLALGTLEAAPRPSKFVHLRLKLTLKLKLKLRLNLCLYPEPNIYGQPD